MACYWPIPALQNGPNGPVRLWPQIGSANLAIPCGKCIGCRTDKASTWAARCSHEASQWEHNVFLTLTYDDANQPQDGHLRPTDLQRFLKRLRKHAEKSNNALSRDRRASIRFLASGEYGDQNNRPHYHALLFNCGFQDTTKVGKDLYESETLKQLWPVGAHRLGEATPAAAAYIGQYNLKKQGQGDHDADGVWRPAPFLRMSLRPAIGSQWLHKYQNDLRNGYLVNNEGKKQKIPRYYKTKTKELNSDLYESMEERIANQQRKSRSDRNEPDRLRDGETIHKQKAQQQHRRL